jgi:hypothetical protein
MRDDLGRTSSRFSLAEVRTGSRNCSLDLECAWQACPHSCAISPVIVVLRCDFLRVPPVSRHETALSFVFLPRWRFCNAAVPRRLISATGAGLPSVCRLRQCDFGATTVLTLLGRQKAGNTLKFKASTAPKTEIMIQALFVETVLSSAYTRRYDAGIPSPFLALRG